tara:strand:- start:822 stop:1217 length:396 start_codon:yes stop_codon:yes gene_type:complete
MDMFDSRISFALDNKEMIEKIDSDENAKNNFMDVLVGIKEEILSREGQENKAIFQMFLFIDIESKNGIPQLSPKVHIISKIYKDYDKEQFGVEIKPSNIGIPFHANTFNQLPKPVVEEIKNHGDMQYESFN